MTKAQTKAVTSPAPSVRDMANAIRALAMDAVQAANSGHPGMPMGMADVATVLFTEALKFDPAVPGWANRDRFVLSAGHGSMLLYALLHLTGYPGMTIEELKNFRQFGSKTAGHPEYGHAPGIETTTGPLGQGLANAVGIALSERLLAARVGNDLIDYHTYVIAGDGCLMEGISQEAISLAGHLKLGKLIVLWDDNSISIDGATSLAVSDNELERFAASGWNTARVDGHDPAAIAAAIKAAKGDSSRPWLIACKTVIGYGAPNKAGKSSAHGEPLGGEEIKATRERLDWPYQPFDVPDHILSAWRAVGSRGAKTYADWAKRLSGANAEAKALISGRKLDTALASAIAAAKTAFAADATKRATRVWSQLTLEHLVPALPELVGGSADLTGSNLTKTKAQVSITPENFAGNYVHYGVREHGMAAAMNGIALSGSFIPYGGTFLVFTDYCRPSIRLSALMEQRVVYVMTHDSIGLGEDGPTHQPVEHLSALRAIPNLNVFRPADGIETAECWELAIAAKKTPSILALSRQAVPNLRSDGPENQSAKGAYVVKASEGARDVTLIATGSEVGVAIEAAAALAKNGVSAAVVSMPSFELFRAQPESYRNSVLGEAPRVAIEAGVAQSWYEWLRPSDKFVGMPGFGASAPAAKLFQHFGITAAHVADIAQALAKKAN
ncbi:transketolase [Hyphomicrobium denitrificans ATCC 51888]|uniref:Transketolase n=1 Tax=Hyphomicrobium denitrificans (strain ATCC 51888 / DSM 1869 / NCIMB 11706 / TK 0415) TaxID=582899 RepID=D8JYH7_HYPDA|nr:transketolase [Hyphomicrobium denitrificans]ADJ23429.1 transketolase [Hyphomicrobium denitrificans ATCC 51888]